MELAEAMPASFAGNGGPPSLERQVSLQDKKI
jgi:hypothetical protein